MWYMNAPVRFFQVMTIYFIPKLSRENANEHGLLLEAAAIDIWECEEDCFVNKEAIALM
jgi:hypothetical protein